MPAADLMIFWNDRQHITQTTRVMTASSTAAGYAIDNAREADLARAWKPSDSASTTEWLKVDGGSTLWLGSGSNTVFVAVAYDARGANQNVIRLQTDSVDDGAFGGTLTDQWTHTLLKDKVNCSWSSFVSPSKRWYRLAQLGTDRSGGNVTAKILYWAMYTKVTAGSLDGDILQMSVDYPGDSEARYQIAQRNRVGRVETAGGIVATNKWATTGQEFSVTFEPASDTLWASIRRHLSDNDGQHRGMFVQKEGLENSALSNFFLCRLLSAEWGASREYLGNYNVALQFRTESWL